MAEAICSGGASAIKSFSSSSSPVFGYPAVAVPGLVMHPALTPDLQIGILSIIDEAGAVTLGNIVESLGGAHSASAALALVAAGVLEIEPVPLIDANTRISRSLKTAESAATPRSADAPPGGSMSFAGAPFEASDLLDAWVADPIAAVLPDGLRALPTTQLQPQIIVGSGAARAGFRRADGLNQPGAYILLRDGEVYVGYGADVGARIATGRQFMNGRPTCIIAIVDAHNGLSNDDAKALERMMWSQVAAARGDFKLANTVPDGAPIDPERYDELSLFTADVVLALRQAGLMFLHGSVRERLAGPRTEPGRLGEFRRIDVMPEGRVMELNYCGLTAIAAERLDGTWLLLRGSDVRIDTVASANASASFQRAAWLHAGLLEAAQDGSCYVVKRDIVFGSGSAVGHFVSGSKGFGLAAWRPLDESEAALPEMAL